MLNLYIFVSGGNNKYFSVMLPNVQVLHKIKYIWGALLC